MSDLADLRLDKPGPGPSPSRDRNVLRGVLIAIVIAAVIVAAYLAFGRRQPPAAVPEASTAPEAPVHPPTAVQGQNVALPPLDQTDSLVRDLVGALSSNPKVAAWLATDGLIRNFVVVTANIAEGHTPVKHLAALQPDAPFQASSETGAAVITPASYARYDAYADAISGIDAHGVAQVYETLKPRIDEAYRQLGYPQGDFDAALKKAFVELLKTPVVTGPVAVTHSAVTYTYADPRLESLSAAQKQLLRTGPRNVQLIEAKLREIAPYVGIAPETLPQPVTLHAGSGV
ncbi:MAG TPA: DUF3014 domain-containing protein [Vicinamibacterales bacterium]|nr:DUF3014 domain-containing protein [Vicinamibacterales bacterium]